MIMNDYSNFLNELNYIQDEKVLENYEVDYDEEVLDKEYNELQNEFNEKNSKCDLDFLDYLIY